MSESVRPTIAKLIDEAIHSLTLERGPDGTFTRKDIIERIKEFHPDLPVNPGSVNPIIQGLVVNAPGGRPSNARARLERIGHGVYRLSRIGKKKVAGEHETTADACTAEDQKRWTGSLVLLDSLEELRMFSYGCPVVTGRDCTSCPIKLEEDEVKVAVLCALEGEWKLEKCARRKEPGPDLVFAQGAEKLIIEAKGEGSRDQMRVNYFLAVLGEILQRMTGPENIYGVALPAHRQFTDLVAKISKVGKRASQPQFAHG